MVAPWLQESGHRLQPAARARQGEGLLRRGGRAGGRTRCQWPADLGQRGAKLKDGLERGI